MKIQEPDGREIDIYNLVIKWEVIKEKKERKKQLHKKEAKSKDSRELFFIPNENFLHIILKPFAFQVRYSPSHVEKEAKQFERIVLSPSEPKKKCPRCSQIKV